MAFSAFGHQIDHEVRGTGRPIVLLHGLTGDRRVLVETCDEPLAAAGLQRVYLDLPGHGSSTGDRRHASADDLVAALGEFIVSVAPDRPLLLGYSYGGYLAQGLLRNLAFSGLMLVCPVIEPDFGKRARPPRRSRRQEALVFTDDTLERDTFEEVAVAQTARLLETYRRVVHPASLAVDRAFVDAVRARYTMSRPYMDALNAFERPVSIVCGRDNHWVGFEDPLRLARAFPRAGVHVLADTGHLLPIEEKVRFQALISDWVSRAVAEDH